MANTDSSLQAAILSDLDNLKPSIHIRSPTGNCTWPLHKSLAVCSGYKDMASHAISNCRVTFPLGNGGSQPCIYTAPGSASVTGTSSTLDGDYYNTLKSTAHILVNEINDHPAGLVSLAVFRIIGAKNFSTRIVDATKCTSSWCAKIFDDTSVTAKQLSENVAETSSLSSSYPMYGVNWCAAHAPLELTGDSRGLF